MRMEILGKRIRPSASSTVIRLEVVMARAPLAGTARTAAPALVILVSRPLSPLPPQCCLSLFVASARSSSPSLSGSSAASTASTWPGCCSNLTATDPSYRRPSDYLCAFFAIHPGSRPLVPARRSLPWPGSRALGSGSSGSRLLCGFRSSSIRECSTVRFSKSRLPRGPKRCRVGPAALLALSTRRHRSC